MEALQPTPERMRHDAIVVDGKPVEPAIDVPTKTAGLTTKHMLVQDALDRYWHRAELSDNPGSRKPRDLAVNAVRYEAGRRLRDAWNRSGLAQHLTGGYVPSVDGYRDPDIKMVRGLDAAKEYQRLIRLAGSTYSAVVIMCCCFGEPVGPRTNMDRLRAGLQTLVHNLGLD
jgi:hypothetical protein